MEGETGADGVGSVLLLDKPAGPTSHDAVERVRRAVGTGRVGHTGTLDPFATGLLVLCVDGATRLAEYFHLPHKTYRATLRLGVETETLDPEGEVTRESGAWRQLEAGDLRDALRRHTGEIRQVPPAFSAKRTGGRRAHEAARAGEPVDLEAETVRVHALELLEFRPPAARILARVSTGTYVRALARDVGRVLGCGAHLRELRRIAVGPLRVEDAAGWDALAADDGSPPGEGPGWLSPLEALPWLPTRSLSPGEWDRIRHGTRIPRGEVSPAESAIDPPDGELPVLLARGDRLVAVAEPVEDELQPRKVWPDAA